MNFTDIYLNKNVDAKESKKQIFFPLLSIAVLSALIFGGNLFGGGKFPITWTPDKIEKGQFIGTSQVINATFKSNKDLENVKFWLTPRLSKYAKVEPETIAKIEKDKDYNISIIVSIPTDFKTQKHEKDDFKNSFKSYLGQDFDEKEYSQDLKDQEEFFKDFHPDKIQGLLFVAQEKQTKWPGFLKQKRTVRKIYPLPLRITINVKKATAQDVLEPFVVNIDPAKIVTSEGIRFMVNEIIILLKDEVKLTDAVEIASSVDGIITGFIPQPQIYKIEVTTNTLAELDDKIDFIKNQFTSLVIDAVRNLIKN